MLMVTEVRCSALHSLSPHICALDNDKAAKNVPQHRLAHPMSALVIIRKSVYGGRTRMDEIMRGDFAPNGRRDEGRPPRKQDVELYIRTYNTLLRSSGSIGLKALEQAHFNIDSNLHAQAASPVLDMSAFFYSMQRLPTHIARARHIVMGQSAAVFAQQGMPQVQMWQPVTAPGRRRIWYFDPDSTTLAIFIGSPSDVDDVVPTIVAYQIEWNKIYRLLQKERSSRLVITEALHASSELRMELEKLMVTRLGMAADDWSRLSSIWGGDLWPTLALIEQSEKNFSLQLLGGTHVGYARSAQHWWGQISDVLRDRGLGNRPLYFVSSNLHSLTNLMSGFVLQKRDELEAYIESSEDPLLRTELAELRSGGSPRSQENFLYYAARKYLLHPGRAHLVEERRREQEAMGIVTVHSGRGLDVDAQIIDISALRGANVDPRIRIPGMEGLAKSDAIILNIDYPLGLGAYLTFRQLAEHVGDMRGIYILGKAATLNGSIGDVMIANVVYDEHSQNTYWIHNCFTARDVHPFLADGSVLDNQKAITVKGTFLQNNHYLDFYYRENYTVVEMEAGPYLDALYEYLHPTRYPTDEQINLAQLPFDVGLLHYASDTPYTSAHTLGARSLSYLGMDSTYAASVAIVRRILAEELRRLRVPAPVTE